MLTLRVAALGTRDSSIPEMVRASLVLTDGVSKLASATVEFENPVTAHDLDNFRWYFERFPNDYLEPNDQIARRVEECIVQRGIDLFKSLFADEAAQVWEGCADQLDQLHVEIQIGSEPWAWAIPWELLRDPATRLPLAIHARSFVRTTDGTARLPCKHRPTDDTAMTLSRVLLVIARPSGPTDVPYRAVAKSLAREFEGRGDTIRLDVLRPPTVAHLREQLAMARAEGNGYHAIHFDCHGIYDDIHARYTGSPPVRPRGYLVLEQPDSPVGHELVPGTLLGTLLVESGVSVVTLNACRSGAEMAVLSQRVSDDTAASFGSLSLELLASGVPGVVAMQYDVQSQTAERFITHVYNGLLRGETLQDAATASRRNLAHNLETRIGPEIRLQDWPVPIVYLADNDSALGFPRGNGVPQKGHVTGPTRCLPNPPTLGFLGRDEAILALDRAFDTAKVVMLYGPAGIGKTATAAEFCRWYTATRGVDRTVFTQVQVGYPLAQLLNTAKQVISDSRSRFEDADTPRVTSQHAERVGLSRLHASGSILWVIDDIDGLAFSTAQTDNLASDFGELASLLDTATADHIRVLLTGRRPSLPLLDAIINRTIELLPMSRSDSLLLVLLEAGGRMHTIALREWLGLVAFSNGNPLTLITVAKAALERGLSTPDDFTHFLYTLRRGDEVLARNEEATGRALVRSIERYFVGAFSSDELRTLELLFFFQSCITPAVLASMVRGLSREGALNLLSRARDIGLAGDLHDDRVVLHPLLPWLLRPGFERDYGSLSLRPPPKAVYLFTLCMSSFGVFLANLSDRNPLSELRAQEDNLRWTVSLALEYGYWRELLDAMRGLEALYQKAGQWRDWRELIDMTAEIFVDPTTGGPPPPPADRDEGWFAHGLYRGRILQEDESFSEAVALYQQLVAWSDGQVAAIRGQHADLDVRERNILDRHLTALNELALSQKGLGDPASVETLKRVISLAKRHRRSDIEASALYNLGLNYATVDRVLDLKKAKWYLTRSLKMLPKTARLERSRAIYELGYIADRRSESAEGQEAKDFQTRALECYQQALALTPPDLPVSLAVKHHALGSIYARLNDFPRSFDHRREAIRLYELAKKPHEAARERRRAAFLLRDWGRLEDALLYARSALRQFKELGKSAANEEEETRLVLESIEEEFRAQRAEKPDE